MPERFIPTPTGAPRTPPFEHSHQLPEAYPDLANMLNIVRWADNLRTANGQQVLGVSLEARAHKMAHSVATGEGLVTNGQLGVDVIRLEAGKKFVPHTHPGDHLLIIVGGLGTITYDGRVYPTEAGEVYMLDGQVAHGVGARSDHVILAVGSPHRPVDSEDRMKPVEYQEVLSPVGDMHCLIDDLKVSNEAMLHDEGCSHCPCPNCNL